MAEKRVYKRYFTKDKVEKINPKNLKAYHKYLRSSINKNRDVKESTYKVYENYFRQFLVYLMEDWDNVYVYDDDFLDEAVDIMEGFVEFCIEKLGNNKKIINTKLSAVSSFYIWSVKRDIIDKHPFDKKLDRMKNAKEEKLIGHHFLDDKQIDKIGKTLAKEVKKEKGKFDMQDLLLWNIALDSANRLGALYRITWSSLNLDDMVFEDIREKGSKIVDVAFTTHTKKMIQEWYEMRREMDNHECDSIFVVKYKGEYQAMSKVSIYKRIKKIGTIVGLDDFRPHCIRKTQLNRVYTKTKDITLAQSLANHESPETTINSYVKPKSKAEIRDSLNDLMKKR